MAVRTINITTLLLLSCLLVIPAYACFGPKLFLGVPPLRMVAPSVYHRPGSLLRTATLDDDGVVLFVEH